MTAYVLILLAYAGFFSVSLLMLGGLDVLCKEVLPIWSGQVQAMRGLTEESVTALANRFAEISHNRVTTLSASASDGGTMKSLLADPQHYRRLRLAGRIIPHRYRAGTA